MKRQFKSMEPKNIETKSTIEMCREMNNKISCHCLDFMMFVVFDF